MAPPGSSGMTFGGLPLSPAEGCPDPGDGWGAWGGLMVATSLLAVSLGRTGTFTATRVAAVSPTMDGTDPGVATELVWVRDGMTPGGDTVAPDGDAVAP